jgi:hypothetical protein
MDLTEFSIACKLISCKLRNFEIPKLLPPTLLASLKHIGTPIRTPTGAMSPTEGYKQFITPAQQPNIPATAMVQQQYQQPMMQQQMMPQQVQMMPQQIDMQQQLIAMQQQMQSLIQQQTPQVVPMAAPAPVPVQIAPVPVQIAPVSVPMNIAPAIIPMSVPTGTILPSQPPLMTNNIPQVASPPLVDQMSSGSLLDSLAQTQPTVATTGPLPAAPTPTPPQSGHASRSMSFSEKAPSVPESP